MDETNTQLILLIKRNGVCCQRCCIWGSDLIRKLCATKIGVMIICGLIKTNAGSRRLSGDQSGSRSYCSFYSTWDDDPRVDMRWCFRGHCNQLVYSNVIAEWVMQLYTMNVYYNITFKHILCVWWKYFCIVFNVLTRYCTEIAGGHGHARTVRAPKTCHPPLEGALVQLQ